MSDKFEAHFDYGQQFAGGRPCNQPVVIPEPRPDGQCWACGGSKGQHRIQFIDGRAYVHCDILNHSWSADMRPKKDGVWQPIESVPKDGTCVLVWLPKPMHRSHVHAASWSALKHGGHLGIIGGVFDFDASSKPTHWMPAPSAPESAP